MPKRIKIFTTLVICLILFIFGVLAVIAADYDYDLSIDYGDISFSEELLYR